jgi:hypothetical protein
VRLRPFAALSVAAVSALLFAGCSGGGEPTASPSASAQDLCAAQAPAGAATEDVTAEGDPGAAPTLTFSKPLEVDELQSQTIVTGDGPRMEAGDYVRFGFVAYDASTGEQLGSSGYTVGEVMPQQVSGDSALGQLLGCATVGSRIIAAFPGDDAAAAQIYALDILDVIAADELCVARPAPETGFPTVAWEGDAAPEVTIPDVTPPSGVALRVIAAGDGEKVQAGDSVTVDYRGVKWSDGATFDSSWDRGEPATFATDQVVAGFGAALVDQPVGSRVLVSMTPECGYGGSQHELAAETLVFAVEILSTERAQ